MHFLPHFLDVVIDANYCANFGGGVPWRSLPQPEHVNRYIEHRGEGGKDAESVCPPWIAIVHIFDRSELHQVKEENTLKTNKSQYTYKCN